MSAHLQRAQLLLQQSRPAEAEQEAGLAIAQAPDNPAAHALLALSLVHQDKGKEAVAAARGAVRCAPDSAYGHYVLALVLHRSSRNREAQASVQEAIRLDPADSESFALLAAILIALGEWQLALEAADQSLALSPENVEAANFRAMALTHLGRKEEAAQTVDFALHREPENAFSHANQGWNCLHRNDPAAAREHFREALRLDPEMEFAREGMLEALKARNWIYRAMLAYFLWMTRLEPRYQWAFIIGSIFVSRAISGVATSRPAFEPVAWVVLPLLYGFVYLTWTAQPMFNLFLRLDRFGRHVLSQDQRIATNWFGPFFLGAAVATAWFFATRHDGSFFSMFFAAALSICVAITFTRVGKTRLAFAAITAVLFLLAVLSLWPVWHGRHAVNGLATYFIYGFLGLQILANFVGTRRT